MIDISDGLAADLHHLCKESGCGAEVDAAAVPISDAASQMTGSETARSDHALADGEDFELFSPSGKKRAAFCYQPSR